MAAAGIHEPPVSVNSLTPDVPKYRKFDENAYYYGYSVTRSSDGSEEPEWFRRGEMYKVTHFLECTGNGGIKRPLAFYFDSHLLAVTYPEDLPQCEIGAVYPVEQGIYIPRSMPDSAVKIRVNETVIGNVVILGERPFDRLQNGAIDETLIERKGNIVANPGFEKEIVSVPDMGSTSVGNWNVKRRREYEVTADGNIYHSGSRSLRIDFWGGYDTNFYHVAQELHLKKNTRYELVYYVRTEYLSSNSGIRLEVVNTGRYMASAELGGTHGWTRQSKKFKTGNSGKVTLRIRRYGKGQNASIPDSRFGQVFGAAWIDDVMVFELGDEQE